MGSITDRSCPHCGDDINEGGFIVMETFGNYALVSDRNDETFKVQPVDTTNGGTATYDCASCEGNIDDFIKEHYTIEWA